MSQAPRHEYRLQTDAPAEHVELNVYAAGSQPGHWHRVLNVLYDEGIVQALSDPAYRLIHTIHRMNVPPRYGGSLDECTGLVFAPIPVLMKMTRRGRTYVYQARQELLAHPRGLLAERERDRYSVMPSFARAMRPHAADPPVRTVRTANPHPADELSAGADAPCVPHREARARAVQQPDTESSNNNSRAVVVETLLGAGMGFSKADAASIAAMDGATDASVRNALAGARRVRAAGKLKITRERDAEACMRAWVTSAIRGQWNLFDQAAADRYSAERRAAAMPQAVADLKKMVGGFFTPSDPKAAMEAATVLSALGGWAGAVDAVQNHLPSWRRSNSNRIVEVLWFAASRRANA